MFASAFAAQALLVEALLALFGLKRQAAGARR